MSKRYTLLEYYPYSLWLSYIGDCNNVCLFSKVAFLCSIIAPMVSKESPIQKPNIEPGMPTIAEISSGFGSPSIALANSTPRAVAVPVMHKICKPIPIRRRVKGDSPYSGIIEPLGFVGSCGLFSTLIRLIIRSNQEKSNAEGSSLSYWWGEGLELILASDFKRMKFLKNFSFKKFWCTIWNDVGTYLISSENYKEKSALILSINYFKDKVKDL